MISKTHWRYFLALEADFSESARYVDFCSDNLKTYSIEFMRILLAAAAQCEVLMHQIGARYTQLPERPNVGHYREALVKKFPRIVEIKIWLPRYDLWVMPWAQWGLDPPQTPDWWHAYNGVKHRPESSLGAANLLNCMGAMGAFLSLVLTEYAIEGALEKLNGERTILFEPDHSPSYLLLSGYGLPEITDFLP